MAQGWSIDATGDIITFVEAPANSAAIVVKEYASATRNVTDVWALGAWSGEYGYPGEVEFFSDRLVFAGTPTQPQTLWMSETGNYTSFGKSQPIEDTDAINATINARQVNAIRDLVPLDSLVILTTGGEWKTTSGQDDVLTPSTVGFKPQTYYGTSSVPSIIIGNTALFVQNRGYTVRDMGYQFESDGYTGSDLTVFSSHLLEGKPIREWAYQQVPHSIVWAVREDGVLLALTYMREQEVVGWTPMEVDGFVESVCCVPEDTEDAVYLIIRREIDGVQKRYVERLSTRLISDVRDATFLDSHLTYDGRNTGTDFISLSNIGSGGWTNQDQIAVTLNFGLGSLWTSDSVGDWVHIYGDTDDDMLRIEITEYIAGWQVRGIPHRTVPEAWRTPVQITNFGIAADTITGLDHLEGKTVGILADGFVQAQQVVTGGEITITPGVVVHVGLPYTSDFETLEINVPGGETVRGRNKIVKEVDILVQDSRSIWVGQDADNMHEVETRDADTGYQSPPGLLTGLTEATIASTWNEGGRVLIQQRDPLPLSILGVIPSVVFGE